MLTIGEKIKQIRVKNSLTQKGFANTLGISTPYLSELENNKKEITSKLIASLNEKFDISSDWLMFSNSEYNSQKHTPNDAPENAHLNTHLIQKNDKLDIDEIFSMIMDLGSLEQAISNVEAMNKKLLGEEGYLSDFLLPEGVESVFNKYIADWIYTTVGKEPKTGKAENLYEIKNPKQYKSGLKNIIKILEDKLFRSLNDFYYKYVWAGKPEELSDDDMNKILEKVNQRHNSKK